MLRAKIFEYNIFWKMFHLTKHLSLHEMSFYYELKISTSAVVSPEV